MTRTSAPTSASDAIRRALDVVTARDEVLNCFTDLWPEQALADAAATDTAHAPGPLAGTAFAVKNLFDVAGRTTLAGSVLLRDRPPALEDAFVVARLRAAGATLVGACNMDEFAYGFSTENAHYGPTRNPHDPERIAGGSSGGSAAAVAAGMVPLALGSDTNGSIRIPAALCGVWGLKPTFGRLSRRGAFPFVHSLDHVGPLAADLAGLARAFDAMDAHDPEDPVACDRARAAASPALADDRTPLRVGRLGGWFAAPLSPEVAAATDRVARAAGATETVELPGAAAARSAAFYITAAEGGALHLPALRTRTEAFDHATRDRLLAGALLPAAYVYEAQRVRAWFRAQAAALFASYDLLIAPTTFATAPRIGEESLEVGGQRLAVRANLGLFTQPLSFIGLPVIAAPVAGAGLPVGVQIVSPPWRENLAFTLAARLERAGVLAANLAGVTP